MSNDQLHNIDDGANADDNFLDNNGNDNSPNIELVFEIKKKGKKREESET